jgi:hypothetical protein
MSAVTVLPTSTDTFGVWLKLPNHEDNVHVFGKSGFTSSISITMS